MRALARLLALSPLPLLLLAAPNPAQAIGSVGLGLAAYADRMDDGDLVRPRKPGSRDSGKKVLDFSNPRTLALIFTVGGGALAYVSAPKGFTIIEKDATSPITVGVMMGLTTLIPTLAAAEVVDDDCLGLLATIPVITLTYLLVALIFDWMEKGAYVGNTVYPLATGAVGVGVGILIAGATKGFNASAGPGANDAAPWRFGAGPALGGGFQLGAAREF